MSAILACKRNIGCLGVVYNSKVEPAGSHATIGGGGKITHWLLADQMIAHPFPDGAWDWGEWYNRHFFHKIPLQSIVESNNGFLERVCYR